MAYLRERGDIIYCVAGKLETILPFRSLRYYFKRYFKGTVKDESGIAFILT